MKRNIKYVLSVALLLLTALLMLCGCSEEKETAAKADPEIKVYWNVDRDSYYDSETKMTMRGKAGENYRVRFAVGGEQVDLFVPTSTMMDNIDSMKFMGLAVDENNVITQVYKPHQFTGGVAAYEYYVMEIDGERVLCNNIANGRGLPLKLKINDKTEIYDVSGGGLLAGIPCDLEVGDQIYAVMGLDGYVSHIYVMPPFEAKPVYFNVNRQWDSSSKTSTRVREASGYFTIDFVVDGEAVSLRTNSVDVINQIDSFGAKCMDLIFDENGNIMEARHAKYATGGGTVASWYHVLRLDKAGPEADIEIVADGFYAEKFSGNDKGSTAQCIYSMDCKIYDMSGAGDYIGQPTELRVGDQIHCLSNPDGDVCLIFIISRPRPLNLYYNIERKWNSTTKASTRTVSSDGYYHFEMSVDGKTVNLKTQDPEIVKTIDGRGAKVVGLELDGNIITAAHAPAKVEGAYKTIFDYADVTQIEENGMITAERNGNTFTGVMAEGCEVYNVSSTAAVKGEPTTVQEGDKLYALGDLAGNIHNIYVVGRSVDSPVYWNLDRSYDSTNKTTKRTPAADGYYYIKLAKGTQTVTFKTKDKALVSKLDSYVAVALRTSGDIIREVYKYDCAKGYTGGGWASWYDVKSVSGKTVTAGNSEKSVTGTLAAGCPVYDVSGGSDRPVTKTTLKVGDKIHGIKDSKGNIVAVYVVERMVQVDLYYNVNRKWDSEKSVMTRVPENGWYWFDMSVNGKQVKLKTNSMELANAIDERGAKVLGLEVKGDQILAVYKPSGVKGSKTTVFDYAVITKISGNVVTATRNGKTFTGTLSGKAKIFNVSSTAEKIGEFTKLEVGDTIYGLGDSKSAVNFVYVTKRTYKTQTKTDLCPVCNKVVKWTSWDGTSGALKEGGHLYLVRKTVVSSTVNIIGDTNVCLDLCGNTVTGRENVDRIFNIYGQLNLMDSGKTGKVIANYSNDEGRTGSVFYIQNSKTSGFGVLNMYGGTLTSTGNTKQGGVGGVANEFNMYGGTITGGQAVKGGNLFVEASSSAKVTLNGGIITGGVADVGCDVYARQNLTVSGAMQINNVYLENGKTLLLNGLTDGAAIGVTMENGYGTFATGAAPEDKDRFRVSDGLRVEYQDGDLVILDPAIPEDPHAVHCLCGGLGAVGDHTCPETGLEWKPWTGQTSGNYYLYRDVELTSTILVAEGETLNLCLNGFDIIGGSDLTRIFNIYGILNLCDHADEQGGYAGDVISNYDIAGENTQTGRVFYVQNKPDAAFNMYGGNLISNSVTNKGAVGGIAKAFRMYAGTISGGKALVCGGNLQIEGGAITIYGGTISGGKSVDGGNIYVNSGTLQIYGGTITGGVAENAGNDVFVNAKPDVTVGGAPVVGNVYLTSGKTITVDGLTDGASIGVTLADTYGTIATGAAEADKDRFTVADGLNILYAGGELYMIDPNAPVEHENHCICGGLGEIGNHTCTESAPVWKPWTGKETEGYYYLRTDMELTATITVAENKTLNLCLNGHTVTNNTTDRIFNLNGTLNLCDHKNQDGSYAGQVISGYQGDSTRTGRIFYVQNKTGAAFNMYGGNLISNSTTHKGAVGGTSKVFNLYAGTISGGNAQVCGGNIQIDGGTTTVYGGTISGGKAADGGNIYVSSGQLNILGGKITGGDVYVSAKSSVTVGGAPQVDNIYLTTGKTVTVKGLTNGAAIGVTLADTYGNFATGAVQADRERFTVADGLEIKYADGILSIADPAAEEPVVPTHADHCVCGGLGAVGNHTCASSTPAWEPWTGTWESGKYYYLTADYDLTATIKLEEGQTLNLCLNGHDIIGGSGVTRIFNIFGVLNLCDHADKDGNYAGDVISNYEGTNTQTGRVFYVQNKTSAALNMYGGNLKSNSSTKNGGIGGVCSAFNLYAGTLSGGTSTEKGGNLMLEAGNAHVTLYGGTITGGTSVDGGNIYIKSSGKVSVNGGTISGGLTSGVKNANNGGNVYVEKGTLTLTDGVISGGYTSNAGGSIRVQSEGVLNINGGLLTGGYAKGNGGNVYSQGTIVMTGGRVCGGTTASNKTGGNLYASAGSLHIEDDPNVEGAPSVTGGSAGTGGNIAIKVDSVEISGCGISGGTADLGGDIYFEKSGGTLNISNCGLISVYVAAGTVNGDEDVTVITP